MMSLSLFQASRVRRPNVLSLFLVLSALAALPLVAVTLPPILDYPNHLARMHILAALPNSTDLRRYYAISWRPLPDLAGDLVVPLLARLMPVSDAMRLFLALALLGAAGGTVALHRAAFGRWSLWPLFAFLLLYNRMLLWGFFNYLAGVALVLWSLALWVALESKPIATRLLAGAACATAIYFAHLAAFGCYALVVTGFALAPSQGESWRARSALRRVLPAIVTLVPAAALFAASPTSDAPAKIAYGHILRKLDLPFSIFDNYHRVFDGLTLAAVAIALCAGLLAGGVGFQTRLRWGLVALVAAFFLLPNQFLTASGIDRRLPIAIAFIFVAATDWTGLRPRLRQFVALALSALFLTRMGIVADEWLRADREYAALRPAFASIPFGAAMAVAAPPGAVRAGGVPLLHYPTLAVIDRDAFVPTLFADPYQQPVHFTPVAKKLAWEAENADLWTAFARGSPIALPGYDALAIVDPPDSLDTAHLPGSILFAAPRLVVIQLSQTARDPR